MRVDIDSSDLGELLDIVKAMVLGEFIIIGPALAVFVGILGSFVITRGITRTIRSKASRDATAGPIKDITVGGVHIHHQVFGIVTMFVAGLLIIATDAQDAVLNTLALLFGVGVGLAFDEFALWLHLEDVYWSRQGRKSIDAVAWTLVATASVRAVLDLSTVFQGAAEAGSMWWLPVLLFLLTVVPAGICAAKGQACHRRPRHRVPTHRPDRRGPARQTRIVVGPPGLRSDLAPPKPRRTALRRELPRSLGTAA